MSKKFDNNTLFYYNFWAEFKEYQENCEWYGLNTYT